MKTGLFGLTGPERQMLERIAEQSSPDMACQITKLDQLLEQAERLYGIELPRDGSLALLVILRETLLPLSTLTTGLFPPAQATDRSSPSGR